MSKLLLLLESNFKCYEVLILDIERCFHAAQAHTRSNQNRKFAPGGIERGKICKKNLKRDDSKSL